MGSNMDSEANDIVLAIIGHEARRRACTDKWQSRSFDKFVTQGKAFYTVYIFQSQVYALNYSFTFILEFSVFILLVLSLF